MAIVDTSIKKPFIDQRGSNGNCFVLLGAASKLGKQLDFSYKQQKEVQTKMMSSSYENLISVFDEYFGEYVDLYI